MLRIAYIFVCYLSMLSLHCLNMAICIHPDAPELSVHIEDAIADNHEHDDHHKEHCAGESEDCQHLSGAGAHYLTSIEKSVKIVFHELRIQPAPLLERVIPFNFNEARASSNQHLLHHQIVRNQSKHLNV